jgi:hypothetical protein
MQTFFLILKPFLSLKFYLLFFMLNICCVYGTDEEKEANKPKEIEKKEKPKVTKTKDTEKVEEPKEIEPPRFGNFSLPISQQPAALFGFGGNIIAKNEIQLYFFADEFVGKKRAITDLIPGILFGVTDDLSLFFNAPFTPIMRDCRHRSSGLEDFFIQLEYSFYSKKTLDYEDQATIVANITVPTGSVKKNPPTGFGAPSFFIGTTFYRTYVHWILITEHGAILTTSDHRTKIGDQFLYQYGVGRTIATPPGYIYAWLVELTGQYYKKNRIHGQLDPNSGGNYIFITPSLWVSSKNFLIQAGFSFPINQNIFGKQQRLDYAFNLNCAWSFY